MLEFLNTIPENVGWSIVCVSGAACAVMLFKFYNLFLEVLADLNEDDEDDED